MYFILRSARQPSVSKSMLNILLLEDDSIDCELIGQTLSRNDIAATIHQVGNRRDFLDYLNQRLPDIILADYVLPTFDGLAALKLAKAICPEVPFILVSGVLGEEQAIEALKQGATDYILKQRLERLGTAVKRALREHRERRERQLVTKALQQTDDLLRAIVDASPVGIVTLTRDQRVMTWNTTAETLYGWSADAVVDHPLSLTLPQQQPAFDHLFEQVLNSGMVADQEFQHLRQGGSVIDVSLSLTPLHDGDGQIYGVVMTTVDITQSKQIEAQRQNFLEQERRARAAAETANRVKDEFLAVLSHELRTPLNAIVGWIKLIQRGGLKPEILQRAFDTIERNALAQTQLIDDLLDISRFIRGQVSLNIQPVKVSKLIQATVDTLRPAAEAKLIQVNVEAAPDTGSILADPNRLQQVFWNLLSNAIKFTPTAGTVTVKASAEYGYLTIQVQDSGIGISPDFLPQVFDYFRQADSSTTRSQGGLGLGLAITRRLVELHGGTIYVDSPGPDQGTTFTVCMPIRQTPPALRVGEIAPADSLSLRGIKAVVIDDEVDAQKLLSLTLEQWGAQVKIASDTTNALALLHEFQPDIIISDIGMPHEDGFSFLQRVRACSDRTIRNTPAIALTAYARDEDRDKVFAVGYQDHITKPYEPAEIVDAVSALVERS